jgi:hypothetical protein
LIGMKIMQTELVQQRLRQSIMELRATRRAAVPAE